MRIWTTYLEVFELSEWEKYWKAYRKEGSFAYTRTQTTFFIMLGVLVATFSFVMNQPSVHLPILWMGVEASVLIVYFILLHGMGYLGWWDSEEEALEQWTKIKKEQKVLEATPQDGAV